jgi:hypothetical protein
MAERTKYPSREPREVRRAHLLLYRQLRNTILAATGENAFGENHRAFEIRDEQKRFYIEFDPLTKSVKLKEYQFTPISETQPGQSTETKTDVRRLELDERPHTDETNNEIAPIVGYADEQSPTRLEHASRRLTALSYLEINTPEVLERAQNIANDFSVFVQVHPGELIEYEL